MTAQNSKMLADMVARLHSKELDPLRPLIDEYLIIRDTPTAKGRVQVHEISMVARARPGGRFSPSSVGRCDRQAILKFLGYKGSRKVNPDKELLFDDGNWRHHKWQALFLDMEAVFGDDEKFKVIEIEHFVHLDKYHVAGNLDVTLLINGVLYVIDIKGINRRGFDWINRLDEPKDDAVSQLLTYMKAKGIDNGILLYDCKDTQRTKCFAVGFDSKHWKQATGWLDEQHEHLEARRIPPKHPDCTLGSSMADTCQFYKVCHVAQVPDKKLQKKAYAGFTSIEDVWGEAMKQFIEKES